MYQFTWLILTNDVLVIHYVWFGLWCRKSRLACYRFQEVDDMWTRFSVDRWSIHRNVDLLLVLGLIRSISLFTCVIIIFFITIKPVCYSFLRKKNHFFKKIITFKSITSVCYNFLKKSEFKNNLKTASNEKLLRVAF